MESNLELQATAQMAMDEMDENCACLWSSAYGMQMELMKLQLLQIQTLIDIQHSQQEAI